MSQQLDFGVLGEPALNPKCSTYMRTSWMLHSRIPLAIKELPACIRFIDIQQAAKLREATRKRNVFAARHSWGNNFYLQRVQEFAERTVIEVVLPGEPYAIANEAQKIADIVETVAVLSSVLFASRASLQNWLGVTGYRKDIVDFIISPGFQYLRSSSKRQRPPRGLEVDDRFARRFRRLNLDVVIKEAIKASELGSRIRQAITWLLQSRLEPELLPAVVKTAIALESLLGGSETEPLSRSISERTAFLLSESVTLRADLSSLTRKFYDSRSRVVHGSSKKNRGLTLRLLEAVDRLTFLLGVAVAANASSFGSFEGVRQWVEEQRWGNRSPIARPFRDGDLKRALALATKE